MREMRAIAFVKRLLKHHMIDDPHYKDVRPHVIEAENLMNDLGSASKFNADWEVFTISARYWLSGSQ